MKKKGLIISTVVMVVVLIASLTTATYAWFTTTASARIENLNVQTQASKGLEIALYDPNNMTGANDYTSGEAKLNGGTTWKGADGSGWGASVDFAGIATDIANGFMAVSGDGNKMFKLNDPNAATIVDGKVTNKTVTVDDAVANTDYFVAYIALHNTFGEAKNVALTNITVTATPNANGQTGMAAALRIAIFVHTGDQPNGTTFDSATTTLVYAPFANLTYDATGQSWDENASADTEGTTYLKSKGNTNYSDAEKDAGTDPLNGWTVGEADGTNTQPNTIDDDFDAAPIQLAASVADKGIVWLKVVVWFEGEDNECLSHFAGGGAQINMNFGFKD